MAMNFLRRYVRPSLFPPPNRTQAREPERERESVHPSSLTQLTHPPTHSTHRAYAPASTDDPDGVDETLQMTEQVKKASHPPTHSYSFSTKKEREDQPPTHPPTSPQDLIKAMKQLQHDDTVPEQTRELINQVRPSSSSSSSSSSYSRPPPWGRWVGGRSYLTEEEERSNLLTHPPTHPSTPTDLPEVRPQRGPVQHARHWYVHPPTHPPTQPPAHSSSFEPPRSPPST